MSIQPFSGFVHFPTHHCITGSIWHIYTYHGYPVSEEMLLGLGAGAGFIYWHMRGSLPFIGGRANIERPGVEGLEKTCGRRTGVRVQSFRSESSRKAELRLLELLKSNQPVMLMLDMGLLPYFDFGGEEFHFGAHAVVVCGYDEERGEVLLADRDEELHVVSLEVLNRARASKYKPFPPGHAWYEFDFSQSYPIGAAELKKAIYECAEGMCKPAISNMGVKGIRKSAERIRQWSQILTEKDLRDTCINTAIMIDARGGTGGGLFRCMYARFLHEAAGILGEDDLHRLADRMQNIADCWEQTAVLFEKAYSAEQPALVLNQIADGLLSIAGEEEKVWSVLYDLTGSSG